MKLFLIITTQIIITFLWLLAGQFLSMAYRSSLKAQMVTVRYEKTINTMEDMLNASPEKVLLLPMATAPWSQFNADPRWSSLERILFRSERSFCRSLTKEVMRTRVRGYKPNYGKDIPWVEKV